ncbi:hypothetical protein PPERSA_08163 [Pseudocohnilembus persalinus]|uniref:EF-hand domain-containing protein n=1 Tax=Pseudocohnilembus persalinus TaxID=266149 RepID=A0A0V0R3N1_PSEPJ|nr:hypothetical protein PPERSA_08163 [Pseudocohnilembus persalinus]|eukprot:KRX08960.1 hypothetical protein PPERSA_08163 [Pseudocohnilembus persalinus]
MINKSIFFQLKLDKDIENGYDYQLPLQMQNNIYSKQNSFHQEQTPLQDKHSQVYNINNSQSIESSQGQSTDKFNNQSLYDTPSQILDKLNSSMKSSHNLSYSRITKSYSRLILQTIKGCAYEKQGNIDQAIQNFSIVLQFDSRHVNAVFARAACQNRKGDFIKAIEDYNKALELDGEKPINQKRQRRLISKNQGLQSNSKTENQFSAVKMAEGGSEEEDFLNPNEYSKMKFIEMDCSQMMPQNMTMQNGQQNISQNQSFQSYSNCKQSNQSSNGKHFSLRDQVLDNTSENSLYESSSKKLNQSYSAAENKQMAEQYHSQGFEARKKGNFKLAIQFYTKALEIMPTHFKAHFNRGFAYDKLGNYNLAIQDYSQALEIDPKNAYAYYNRGISLDRQNQFDQAIQNFTQAINIDPSKADFYHNRAFAYRKKKNFKSAVDDYTTAIDLDPQHFKAYYNRAFCLEKLGDFEQAEADYIQALTLQPKNINVLYHFGCLLEKQGDERLEDALSCFNETLIIDQNYAPGFNARGLIKDKMGLYEEAYNDFTSAINIDPKNPVFIHNRACCLRNTGRLQEAINDFEIALEFDKKNPIIFSNLGLVYRKLENYQKAINCYTEELKYSKDNSKTINNRAYCFAKLKMYEEAINDYSKALSIDEKNIHSLHNRGICYERMGFYKQAIEDFSEVIKLNKDNANALFNRGCCYDSIGELDLAIQDYSAALEIDSKNQQSLENDSKSNISFLSMNKTYNEDESQQQHQTQQQQEFQYEDQDLPQFNNNNQEQSKFYDFAVTKNDQDLRLAVSMNKDEFDKESMPESEIFKTQEQFFPKRNLNGSFQKMDFEKTVPSSKFTILTNQKQKQIENNVNIINTDVKAHNSLRKQNLYRYQSPGKTDNDFIKKTQYQRSQNPWETPYKSYSNSPKKQYQQKEQNQQIYQKNKNKNTITLKSQEFQRQEKPYIEQENFTSCTFLQKQRDYYFEKTQDFLELLKQIGILQQQKKISQQNCILPCKMKLIFDFLDHSKNQRLYYSDFYKFLNQFFFLKSCKLENAIAKMDVNGQKYVIFEDFKKYFGFQESFKQEDIELTPKVQQNFAQNMLNIINWDYEISLIGKEIQEMDLNEKQQIFNILDYNQDGFLDLNDICFCFGKFNIQIDVQQAQNLIKLMDWSDSGKIGPKQFLQFLYN